MKEKKQILYQYSSPSKWAFILQFWKAALIRVENATQTKKKH
jgi:hypothetical protein